MPDEDEIELPRYCRPIGVARGPVTDAPNTEFSGYIGVLSPFAGVLNGPVEADRGPSPAFSYLTLGPLVIERVLERESVTVRAEESDRPETAEELRVRHLLWRDPTAPEADRPAPSDPSEPIREVAVPGTAAPGEGTPDDRTDTPAGAIRNVSVLGNRDLTVLERFYAGAPSAGDRGEDPRPDRTGAPSRGEHLTIQETPRSDEQPTLSPSMTMTTVTDTTVQRSPPARPGPLRPVVEKTSERPATASPGRGSHDRSDNSADTDLGVRTTPASQERPRSERSPELTVVAARPAGENDETRLGTEGERVNGLYPRDRSTLDGDRPAGRTRREGPPQRPPQEITMTELFDDTVEMNRFVDRLYREFQRKERIERERRGL